MASTARIHGLTASTNISITGSESGAIRFSFALSGKSFTYLVVTSPALLLPLLGWQNSESLLSFGHVRAILGGLGVGIYCRQEPFFMLPEESRQIRQVTGNGTGIFNSLRPSISSNILSISLTHVSQIAQIEPLTTRVRNSSANR